jgi:hypothetical protein
LGLGHAGADIGFEGAGSDFGFGRLGHARPVILRN